MRRCKSHRYQERCDIDPIDRELANQVARCVCVWINQLTGNDVPVEVEQVESKNPDRDTNGAPNDDLSLIPKQAEERSEEVTEDQAHAHAPPRVGRAVEVHLAQIIPEGFFRNIRTVDQEILRETDVSPEDGERQHQAAEIVTVRLLQNPLQIALASENHSQDDQVCECSTHTSGEEPHTIHGREPVVFERFEPVNRTECHCNRADKEPNCRQRMRLRGVLDIASLIGIERPLT